MPSRRGTLLIAAAALGLGGLVAYWGGAEQRAIRAMLEQICQVLTVTPGQSYGERDRQLQETLERYFDDSVTVRSVDLPRAGSGRPALLTWARLVQQFHEAAFQIQYAEITTTDDVRGEAQLRVGVQLVDRSGRFVDERAVSVGLVKRGTEWRIGVVDIAASPKEVPEARP